jgi:hypothetical protein
MAGLVFFAAAMAGFAWFLRAPRRKMVFAVSPAQLRIDAEYAVRANNMEGV